MWTLSRTVRGAGWPKLRGFWRRPAFPEGAGRGGAGDPAAGDEEGAGPPDFRRGGGPASSAVRKTRRSWGGGAGGMTGESRREPPRARRRRRTGAAGSAAVFFQAAGEGAAAEAECRGGFAGVAGAAGEGFFDEVGPDFLAADFLAAWAAWAEVLTGVVGSAFAGSGAGRRA